MEEQGQSGERGGSPLPEELQNQLDAMANTERAIAISFHAGLEEKVREAIIATFHASGESAKRLLGGTETPGVLGFSDQCKLAHCLGLFGPQTLSDLKRLTRVRNRFAHTSRDISFNDPKIKGLCDALWAPVAWDVIVSMAPPDLKEVFERDVPKIKDHGAMKFIAAITVITTGLAMEVRAKSKSPLSGPTVLR